MRTCTSDAQSIHNAQLINFGRFGLYIVFFIICIIIKFLKITITTLAHFSVKLPKQHTAAHMLKLLKLSTKKNEFPQKHRYFLYIFDV